VNLLLVDQSQVSQKRITLEGRQAKHCLQVLKVKPGSTIRAGVINEGKCSASVLAIDGDKIDISLGELHPETPPTLSIALALPRPKALSRIVSALASFGVHQIFLINAWRVERSYFSSPRLFPERLKEDLWLGCEQGAQTWLPSIRIVDSFRRFVEDVEPQQFSNATQRILFHPGGHLRLNHALKNAESKAALFAFGPEGGFVKEELLSWEKAGYSRVDLGTGPLQTGVAINAAMGQFALLKGIIR